MVKKIALSVALLIGFVWAAATFIFNLWAKPPAADNLLAALKPAFTDAALAQEASDAKTVDAFVNDLNTTTVPLLAKLTGKSAGEVVTLVSTAFPEVGKLLATADNSGQPYADGKTYLDHANGYVTTVATALNANKQNWVDSRNLPTKDLPMVTVTVLFLVLGLAVLAIGFVALRKPALGKPMGALLIVVGLVVPVVTFLISVPRKTQSVDQLTNAFRPVFATSGALSIDEGQAYLKAVRAADQTLEAKLVPTLADLLKLSPETVTSTLKQTSPVVATALFAKDPANAKVSVLGGILDRWDGIAAIVVDERPNFKKTDNIPGWGMPTTMVQFLLVAPALLLALAGVGVVVSSRTRATDTPTVPERVPVSH